MKYTKRIFLSLIWLSLSVYPSNSPKNVASAVASAREVDINVELGLNSLSSTHASQPLDSQFHPDSHDEMAKRIMNEVGVKMPATVLAKHLEILIRSDKKKYDEIRAQVNPEAITRRRRKKQHQSTQVQGAQQQVGGTSSSVPASPQPSAPAADEDANNGNLLKLIGDAVTSYEEGNQQRAKRDCHKIAGLAVASVVSLGINAFQAWLNSKA